MSQFRTIHFSDPKVEIQTVENGYIVIGYLNQRRIYYTFEELVNALAKNLDALEMSDCGVKITKLTEEK